MTGRRRLAGARLEGNQANRSNLRTARASPRPPDGEPSSAGKTNPATSWFQEELYAPTLGLIPLILSDSESPGNAQSFGVVVGTAHPTG